MYNLQLMINTVSFSGEKLGRPVHAKTFQKVSALHGFTYSRLTGATSKNAQEQSGPGVGSAVQFNVSWGERHEIRERGRTRRPDVGDRVAVGLGRTSARAGRARTGTRCVRRAGARGPRTSNDRRQTGNNVRRGQARDPGQAGDDDARENRPPQQPSSLRRRSSPLPRRR